MIYYLTFIFLAIWAFSDLLISSFFWKFIPSLFLILLVGLRSENVGWDTIRYVNDYNQILWGFSPIQNFEFGFQAFEKIIAYFGFSVNVFFLIVSFLTLYLLNVNYHNYTTLGSVAILYYYARFFLNRDMNQIRAALAAVIILFSIKYLIGNQNIKFLLTILLAAQFHNSSLIMLMVYPVFKILLTIKQTRGFFILCCVFILSIAASFIVSPLLNILFSILGTGSVYINYSGYVAGAGLLNPVLLLQLFISFLFAHQYFNKSDPTKLEAALLATYLVSTCILISLSQYAVLAGRLSTMLATVEPILLIYILKKYLKDYTVIVLMICISLFLFYILFTVNGDISQVFEPYTITFK